MGMAMVTTMAAIAEAFKRYTWLGLLALKCHAFVFVYSTLKFGWNSLVAPYECHRVVYAASV